MNINDEQIKRIAARYVDLLDKFGWGPIRESEGESRLVVEMRLRNWHKNVEPLNFDILEIFPDLDFSHDIGGIMRDDKLMSARCALAYHPIE